MHPLTAQGRLADAKLASQGLILTQGGEPTFVPHNTSAPEWNVAALGPEKLLFARRLARQLAMSLYPGAVVVQSFGKQYPNEPLPRWQLGLYRSRTGTSLWKDLNRLRLDENNAPADAAMARQFLKSLVRALKLQGAPRPVFEDLESHLRAAGGDAAARLLPRFSRRRGTFKAGKLSPEDASALAPWLEPAGWVLPLAFDGETWRTEQWQLSGEGDITLLPGDSPVGLRLPLFMLPEHALKSALTVECKQGELIVFLPPLPTFAAFCSLVRTIEQVAARLASPPLRLEGYPPPRDEDLESIGFMSDPGVIEVNLPPADNWPEFERVVRGLFDAAATCGLRGFKFQLSGRRVSTGGGAHIILGGPDLARNPFIQRPALLSSFLRFTQNHPGLSYVFSGLFTGPSCQAPRVDESVPELPYELEITLRALEAMPPPGDPVLMDAMLRNLLMDWNGNTHRAELSVDKFHNQDAPNGRHGLIEFRAFEMTPTADMHLAANLLLRALAATFAEKPFNSPLTDWGMALHDRFALPYFLRRDLREIVAYLNGHGFAFDADWFEPHLDFRFPVITRWATGRVNWTLRHAIEPWPVMGEHTGTGRVVDATTDRLELLAEGLGENDSLIPVVNGLHAPLLSQGNDVAVGAVRYRLFTNPWGLQPQVSAHSPLRFEIVDTSSRRIIHAFDYLNWKRDGGNYERPPQDQADADQRVWSRVVSREERCGAAAEWRVVELSPQAPFTLDLRRW
jgi:uncharacterized protein (DUF2126 family)